jgi:hypothetical protein
VVSSFEFFRRFAKEPSLEKIEKASGATCGGHGELWDEDGPVVTTLEIDLVLNILPWALALGIEL